MKCEKKLQKGTVVNRKVIRKRNEKFERRGKEMRKVKGQKRGQLYCSSTLHRLVSAAKQLNSVKFP